MSGPHTEDPGMPHWPALTLPETRLLADLHRQAHGTVPDDIQARLDELATEETR